jgi:Undecaprenyl-phosphate glucose phosphotransferase
MFRVRAYLIQTYLVCFDLAVIGACVAAAWRASGGPFAAEHAVTLMSVSVLWLAFSYYFGLYQSRRLDRPFADVLIIGKVSLASLLVLEAAAYRLPGFEFPREFPPRFCLLTLTALAIARLALRLSMQELRRRGYNTKNLVLVTSPELGIRLAEKLERHAHYGYRVLRHFQFSALNPEAATSLVTELREYLRGTPIDDVILALPARFNDLAARLIVECENQGIYVRIVPDLLPLIRTDTQIHDLDGVPLVNVRYYPPDNFRYAVLKRALDLGISLAVLIFFLPLFLLVTVLIKLTSPGPVFFTQERVGLNGRAFTMLKFRTMRQDSALDSACHWTRRDDPHVTPLGRWLRRSNLDELPQFLNVLKGDMSVVGPRPERRFFLERFRREVPEYMARHYVKSGITGWAQVNGWRGDTSIVQRVAHDLYYIRNWAMGLDLKILLLTLTRSFFHRNAY